MALESRLERKEGDTVEGEEAVHTVAAVAQFTAARDSYHTYTYTHTYGAFQVQWC